jgi:predicted Abi (CAAX) family protease
VIPRLRGLFTTMAAPGAWARLLGLLLALLAASWLLDRLGLAPWRPDFAFLLGFGPVAGLGTALAEEALFRGILLKPPPEGAPGLGRSALSALVFALWHPFQTFFYHPLWEPYAWRWWFLLGTGLLGFLCARFTLSSRSIWPAVVLHLVAALAWKTLYGIPSCGLAPCVLYS